MVKCGKWDVGICSWSLQKDIEGVADALGELGVGHVHLAVRSAVEDDTGDILKLMEKQSWTVSSTMIDFPQEDYASLDAIKVTGGLAPDDCWEKNKELFLGAVDVTARLSVKYLSMHAGFIDESTPEYAKKFHDRLRLLADAAEDNNAMLLL